MAHINLPYVGNVVQVGSSGDATTFTMPADKNLDGHASWVDSLADADTAYYFATSLGNKSQWEFGLGTWAETARTLTRTTVLRSSAGTTKVDFESGGVEVRIALTGDICHLADWTLSNVGATRTFSGAEGTAANISAALSLLIQDLITAGVLK